jgi:NAD(P)-dependent dehydrogenase (short-subunit alcohol dehydrogenase family)
MSKVILITGCSSGIGAAIARAFNSRGHTVYASARRPEMLAPLAEEGIETLALDVNDDTSIAAAMDVISQRGARLDMLVNNAGFSQVGAVLDLERDDLRRQYETNVISPFVVARQALPLLRASVTVTGTAHVVNIGSIVGLFTTPFAGSYCSSKAALHSLSDALRMELAPFGIRVITVQPGGVKSSFGDNAEQGLRLPEGSPWLPVKSGIVARAQAGQQGATPTEAFVQPVVDKLLRDRPPAVIRGGKGSVTLVWMKRLLPLRMFDNMLARRFGLDELRGG